MDNFLTPSKPEIDISELLLNSDTSDGIFEHIAGGDGLGFLLISAFGLAMALVYVPIRLFLTITARSRRLKLLQRIRKLRESITKPVIKDS